MRTVSVELAAHLASDAHTLATCWLVERVDGQTFGFTNHDRDLVIGGVTYQASTGIDRSALESRNNLAVGNAEAVGFLDSAAITDEDIGLGKWDHAAFRIFEVNWRDLSMGRLKQMRGWLGEVTREGGAYKVELRSLANILNTNIGEIVGAGCTARLGDARCGVALSPFRTADATVATVSSRRAFTSADITGEPVIYLASQSSPVAPAPEGYFAGGKLTWNTGANAGTSMEVKSYSAAGAFVLQLPMGLNISVGDAFTVHAGCDKSRTMCVTRFGNVVNFRGFPDLPGVGKISKFGGQ